MIAQVVSYIYFTRIVVFLLRNTLPYKLEWLSYMSQEVSVAALLHTMACHVIC